jgi:threonylcarbamoyladenosine tRNA methylthiotransferase MtaB
MPQLPREVRKQRAALLRAAGEAARRRFFAARLGREVRVLVEKSTADGPFGHCEHFAPVRLESAVSADNIGAGNIVTARISGANDNELIGRPAAA